jgi:hypothetical protein
VLGNVRRPDGEPFTNIEKNWQWFLNHASKAARYLGYVPFERIRDERNAAPYLYLPEWPPSNGQGRFVAGERVPPIMLNPLLPHLESVAPRGAQPFRVIMIGEKSSLLEVLGPIAQQIGAELLLPTGESTDTMVFNCIKRVVADGRPAVILYFADFDPAGTSDGGLGRPQIAGFAYAALSRSEYSVAPRRFDPQPSRRPAVDTAQSQGKAPRCLGSGDGAGANRNRRLDGLATEGSAPDGARSGAAVL